MAPTLGYWKWRGVAEPIRILLRYVDEDFEDIRLDLGPAPDYDKKQWLDLIPQLGLDFPNLPYFIDGMWNVVVVQM